MLGLKIFVRVQTFRRRAFAPSYNFCHLELYYIILMTTPIILKFSYPRLISHFLFGARGNCKKWLNPLVQRQSQLQSHGKFLPFLQFSMDTFWISSEVHVFKPKLESCYQIDFQPYSHSEYFMSG